MAKKKTSKAERNVNVNVNMQTRMVRILDALVRATGCSTRAECVRNLVREEAKRQGVPLSKAKPAQRKR